MAKKLSDVIKMAQAKGLQITAKVTTENGWQRVRVKSITDRNGITLRFTGSRGNTALRIMMREQESALAVSSRRKSAALFKGKTFQDRAVGAPKLTKAQLNAIRRVNQLLKKQGKTERASITNYRKRKAREGDSGVADAMNNTILHYEGYAYPANIAETAIRFESLPLSHQVLTSLIAGSNGNYRYASDKGLKDDVLAKAREMSYDKTLLESMEGRTEEEKLRNLDKKIANHLKSGIETMRTIKKL